MLPLVALRRDRILERPPANRRPPFIRRVGLHSPPRAGRLNRAAACRRDWAPFRTAAAQRVSSISADRCGKRRLFAPELGALSGGFARKGPRSGSWPPAFLAFFAAQRKGRAPNQLHFTNSRRARLSPRPSRKRPRPENPSLARAFSRLYFRRRFRVPRAGRQIVGRDHSSARSPLRFSLAQNRLPLLRLAR